jgi:hypothetical protein
MQWGAHKKYLMMKDVLKKNGETECVEPPRLAGSEKICMPYGIQQIQQHCMAADKEKFVLLLLIM